MSFKFNPLTCNFDLVGGGSTSGGIQSIQPGGGIEVDNLDPANPLVSVSPIPPLDIDGDSKLFINQSGNSTDGYLTFSDWNAFNNKQDALPLSNPGETLYYNGGLVALSPANDGDVLTLSGGLPVWQASSSSGLTLAQARQLIRR